MIFVDLYIYESKCVILAYFLIENSSNFAIYLEKKAICLREMFSWIIYSYHAVKSSGENLNSKLRKIIKECSNKVSNSDGILLTR